MSRSWGLSRILCRSGWRWSTRLFRLRPSKIRTILLVFRFTNLSILILQFTSRSCFWLPTSIKMGFSRWTSTLWFKGCYRWLIPSSVIQNYQESLSLFHTFWITRSLEKKCWWGACWILFRSSSEDCAVSGRRVTVLKMTSIWMTKLRRKKLSETTKTLIWWAWMSIIHRIRIWCFRAGMMRSQTTTGKSSSINSTSRHWTRLRSWNFYRTWWAEWTTSTGRSWVKRSKSSWAYTWTMRLQRCPRDDDD